MPYKNPADKRAHQNKWRAKNKDKTNISNRTTYLLRTYGITEDDYQSMLAKNSGCCWCCGKAAADCKRRLAVDHDHHTGEVRGLLCIYCNRRIIGRHRNPEGVVLLEKAVKYLKGPYPGWVVPAKKKRKKRVLRSRK